MGYLDAMDEPNSADKVELTDDLLPIKFEVAEAELQNIDNESEFLHISFELLKELSHWLVILTGVVTDEPLGLNAAIVRGHTVRLMKITRTMVREMIQDEPDQQLALVRELLETVATLAYLLDDTDGSRCQAYIQDSLVAERETMKEVTANISNRGEAIAIEQRMLRSIERTAAAAGIADVGKLPGRKTIGWPSVEDRIKLLGPTAYVAYRSASSEVHGTWSNLYRNHLTTVEGGFTANLKSTRIRPQPPLAAVAVLCRVYLDTLDRHVPVEYIDFFAAPLRDLSERAEMVDRAHETWLQNS